MPPELQLPKTLYAVDRAAVGPAAGNTVAADAEAADRAAYEAALRSELPATRLPLERFLVDGGWPMDAVVRVVGATADDASLRLTLAVTFDELVTACGGSPDARPRLGEITLVIDRATAIANVK